jgi:hypothetical protein
MRTIAISAALVAAITAWAVGGKYLLARVVAVSAGINDSGAGDE